MNIIDSFSFEDDKKPILEEFKKIAKREGKSKSELTMELIEQHVKNHSEGNPNFTMEQFQQPDFKAMPATMSPMMDWKKFIMNNTDKKEREELELRARSIIGVINDKRKQEQVEAFMENKN